MMDTTCKTVVQTGAGAVNPSGERGSALILTLMVALVLAFLGVGLLLQTSLGLQASGTDRWVVKSLAAADAGLMMEIQMIQSGFVVDPATFPGGTSFILVDDPDLPGPLRGEYTVTVRELCEAEPPSPIIENNQVWEQKYKMRFFHIRAEAVRSVGGLMGSTAAAVEADVTVWPFDMSNFVPVTFCN